MYLCLLVFLFAQTAARNQGNRFAAAAYFECTHIFRIEWPVLSPYECAHKTTYQTYVDAPALRRRTRFAHKIADISMAWPGQAADQATSTQRAAASTHTDALVSAAQETPIERARASQHILLLIYNMHACARDRARLRRFQPHTTRAQNASARLQRAYFVQAHTTHK